LPDNGGPMREPRRPWETRGTPSIWNTGKIVAVMAAVAYFVIAPFASSLAGKVLAAPILGAATLIFAERLSDFTDTPAVMYRIVGWGMLSIPLLVWLAWEI